MISRRKMGIAAASFAAAGVVGAGLIASAGSAFADPSADPSAGASRPAKQKTPGAAPSGTPSAGARPEGKGDRQQQARTEVTGAEAEKVIAAVKAKDAAVTDVKVFKKADGSYEVDGTKDGAKVHFHASADLATVTLATRGPGGKGGKAGGQHTEVPAAEADKVIAAVKAKDATITVTTVVKDADGSYDAIGTKDGAKVKVDVSADLATVTVKTGR